jgi:hypothetical protein
MLNEGHEQRSAGEQTSAAEGEELQGLLHRRASLALGVPGNHPARAPPSRALRYSRDLGHTGLPPRPVVITPPLQSGPPQGAVHAERQFRLRGALTASQAGSLFVSPPRSNSSRISSIQ